MASSPRILICEATHDETTSTISNWRSSSLYPRIDTVCKVDTFRLVGEDATRERFAAITARTKFPLILGMGHGDKNVFFGQHDCDILRVGHYDKEEIHNAIIHLLSCMTAQLLGCDLVSRGARAYLGYNDPYIFIRVYGSEFLQSDGEIDLALAEGRSAEEAYERACILYRSYAKSHADKPRVAAAFLENCDSLRLIGDRTASLSNITVSFEENRAIS